MIRADSGYNRSLPEGARRLSLMANASLPLSGQCDVVRAWSSSIECRSRSSLLFTIDSNSDSICGSAV